MSATVFVQNETDRVTIVAWFLDKNGNIELAVPPLIEITGSDFRLNGWRWLQGHLSEYRMRRIEQRTVGRWLDKKDGLRLSDASKIISIKYDQIDTWVFRLESMGNRTLSSLKNVDGCPKILLKIDEVENRFIEVLDLLLGFKLD